MHCNALHCWWLTGTQLWLLSLRFSNTDRHLGFEQHPRTQQLKPVTARRAYSSSKFKNIRAHQPKCRLQPQLSRKLQDLGLTKRYRSKRGGQPRIHGNPVLPLTGIPLPPSLSPNGSNHSSVRPFAKNVIPTTMVANVQSLVPKLDELLAALEVYPAEFVCLTETWLNESCPDSLVHLPGYLCFRNDLQNRRGGGVCENVKSLFPCKRMSDFEEPDLESVWIFVRPYRLPRCASCILVGAVHHPPSNGDMNERLVGHIDRNCETFFSKHPDRVIIVTGDFNPISTGLKPSYVTYKTGLMQIVKVLPRDTGTLDWVLNNKPKFFLGTCATV